MAVTPAVAKWMKDRRGITQATLTAFGVETDGTVEDLPIIKLPYPGATKYRKGLEKEGRSFWWSPPDKHGQALFTPPDAASGSKMILVEGETDTMALWQNAPDAVKPNVRGLPGTESWKEHFQDDFQNASIVYVIMDNDDWYDNASAAESGDRGFKKIKECLGARRVRRVTLPQGTKDLCEFFQKFDWAALKVLLDKATEIKLPYQRLDLTQPAPDYDWLVTDLLAKGDVSMLSGFEGVGKSWISLDLALCVAGLRDEWLGMKVNDVGPVVVVDQENPQTTARQRMKLLGLPDGPGDVQENLHYLWYQGIRLDTQAEMLYEYCDLVRPKFIVIDTLSRAHFGNENSAEDMNPLMNGGVYPLARQLGCTVMLLHHLAKHGGSRGSTAIPAATDLNLSFREQELKDGSTTGMQWLRPDKQRNTPSWGSALLTKRVTDDPTHPTMLRIEALSPADEEDY